MAQGLGKPASFVLTDELLLRLSHLQRRLLQQTQPRACSSPTVSLLPLNTKRLFARQCGSAGLDQPRDEAGVNHGLITSSRAGECSASLRKPRGDSVTEEKP